MGVSVPELMNVKIKYGSNFQIGGGAGYLPYFNLFGLSGDINLHFPTKSGEETLRKWFLNTGFSYFPPCKSFSSTSKKTILMHSRIGRTLYSPRRNNKTGLRLELGIMFEVWTNEGFSVGPHITGKPRTITDNPAVLGPAASISYFFKR